MVARNALCPRQIALLVCAFGILPRFVLAGRLRITSTCCCFSQPSGQGCGEIITNCDSTNCDGNCVASNKGCVDNDTTHHGERRFPKLEEVLATFLQTRAITVSSKTNLNTTMDANQTAIFNTSFSTAFKINPNIVENLNATSAFETNASNVFEANLSASFQPPMASSPLAVSKGPAHLIAAKRAAKRAAMLKKAEKNLVEAEEDVIKYHGVHIGDALPQNVLITIVHADNLGCVDNLTDCEWRPLPVSWYGGDIPVATKNLFHYNEEEPETVTLSCVVCDDKSRCTKPEPMAHAIKLHLYDGVKRTRSYLVDMSTEIAAMEKKCRYTPPSFDTKLLHLRNQYSGLSGIWGKAPELDHKDS